MKIADIAGLFQLVDNFNLKQVSTTKKNVLKLILRDKKLFICRELSSYFYNRELKFTFFKKKVTRTRRGI